MTKYDPQSTKMILWCDLYDCVRGSGWADRFATATEKNAHAIIVDPGTLLDPDEVFPCPVEDCKGVCRASPIK